jgi:peptidoglycan/LPS O-acetylase OafA/YrhL
MSYNPALDGVRALSILVVLCFHCFTPGFSGGFAGLDVFFVLSGYLITSLLATEYRHGKVNVSRFYARRALRLYPSLLLLIAAYLLLSPLLWPNDEPWLVAALSAFYLLDYGLVFANLPLPIAATWSLGVEEKFYLMWPFVLPLVLRSRRPIAWLIAAFVAVTAWRFFVTDTWGWARAYFCFDTRMSGILLGAIGALTRFKISRSTFVVACIALAINIAMPIPPAYNVDEATMPRITLAELCAFVLVCYVAENATSRFFSSAPMVYIGRLSYGIFLWHFPVVILLRGSQPLWITLSATLVFSFTMAAICLHFVDLPIKRWRERERPPGRRAADGLAT